MDETLDIYCFERLCFHSWDGDGNIQKIPKRNSHIHLHFFKILSDLVEKKIEITMMIVIIVIAIVIIIIKIMVMLLVMVIYDDVDT